MGVHAKLYSYEYGASKVISINVSDSEVIVSAMSKSGEPQEIKITHQQFFEKKPVPGMWLVNGFMGEWYFVNENEIYRLGKEITTEND